MREKPGVCRVCGCSACFFRPTLNSSLLWGRDQIVLGCWQHEDETMSDPDCQELIDRKEVLGPNFGFAFDQDTREWEETGRCSDRSARRNEFVPEAGAQPRANMPSSGYEGHPTSHPQAHQLTSPSASASQRDAPSRRQSPTINLNYPEKPQRCRLAVMRTESHQVNLQCRPRSPGRYPAGRDVTRAASV